MNQSLKIYDSRLPAGAYPAMLTAFHDDGAIDWDGVDRLTDYCIEAGAAGIFACGLSAEILQMDDEERTQLAERIIQRADDRLPIVVTAITSGSLQRQAALVSRMHGVGAEVVAIGVCQLVSEQESDQTWIDRAEELLEQVPADVQFAMYECPLPYHRLLSEKTFKWAAATGRFQFLKDTSCCIKTIRARLKMLGSSPLQMFNAHSATLLASLQAGLDGFCGIGANFMPEIYVWMCENFDSDPQLAADLQRFMDSTFDLTEDSTYPASAKFYLQQRGLPIGAYSRKVPAGITAEGGNRLLEMLAKEREWLARIDVQPVHQS